MLARTYAVEAAVYRAAGMVEDREQGIDKNVPSEILKAVEEYAIECALVKVAGTEVLFYCADEGVQIYGGNGFTEDYPVEGVYRDCRVNRILRETNEINRLLIPRPVVAPGYERRDWPVRCGEAIAGRAAFRTFIRRFGNRRTTLQRN